MIQASTIELLGQASAAASDEGFRPGDLLWGAPEWALPAAMIAIVLAGLVLWSYLRPDTTGAVRATAGLLKLIAIMLLAICLLEPMRSGTRPRPQANVMPILVDNSQSMRLKSSSDRQSRRDQVVELLGEDQTWRTRVSQAFDVRSYAFDARLERVEDYSSLQADGYVSSLAGSLQSLSERFADRPVAGAILFTDGNLTDMPSADFDWSSLGFPVYPVLPKSDGSMQDIRIAGVSVRQTDFESAPTTVNVAIDAIGMQGEQVVVQLKDVATEKLVSEQTVSLGADGDSEEVRFRFRPEQSGVSFHTLSVFREVDREAMEGKADDQVSQEATLENNRRILTIDRTSGPYRVLYLAGRPNWEYKFLRRALEEDAELQLVSLIRVANKEAKFSFRDKGVNDSNPLFAGLGADEEEAAQQYDEPVIIRLGVKEAEELSDGFPESAEELFGYHGIILDDIESDFFTQDQMLLLRRFVGSRGGGLLMLGGAESFASKKFAETPLGELSPVYSPRASAAHEDGPYQLQLTREGLLQPWVRLRETETQELDRLQTMTTFKTLNSVGDVKPGASQLASAVTPSGKIVPALVAQRFGKGRTAALTIGDVWRWSMRRDEKEADDPGQAWRQLTHWLVNDVPKRAELRVESTNDPSKPVSIVCMARDESFLPIDNATVELTITPLSGEPFTLKAEMDPDEAGTYRASYWSREPDGYRVEAMVTAADGSEVGAAQSGWTAQAGAAEFADLRTNRSFLERIAQETGGEIVDDDDLDEFATALPSKKVPVTENWVYPIWHRAWVMFAAMMCLCMEWGLRRWKGLA
ncbi:MAG: hypothetical protein AB8B91_02410 [Rubripirellula sp.]